MLEKQSLPVTAFEFEAAIRAAQINQVLLSARESGSTATEKLIATGLATFELIRIAPLDPALKTAFRQLEKQFVLYAELVRNCK